MGIKTTGEERCSFTYGVRLGSVVVIGGRLVSCSVEYIIAVCIHHVPERVTVSRINSCPFLHIPGIDILSFFNLLVNRRSLLLDWRMVRQFYYAVLVETDIEAYVPAPFADIDDIRVDAILNAAVANFTHVLHHLIETG